MADFKRDNKTYSSPYADLPGYKDAFNTLVEQAAGLNSDSDQTRQDILNRLNNVTGEFKNLFQNNVGREANNDEIGKFISENAGNVIKNSPSGRSEENPTGVRNQIAQYVGDTFQPAAQATAQTKLTDLAGTAGTLADQFKQMGQTSLSGLADQLKNYQVSLFDKLRPQLNMTAQAGGFSGGGGQTLQEQGALRDLGNQAAATLIPLQNQLDTQANAIRYGGASAPYSLASTLAANAPSNLSGFGSNALSFNNDIYNTNLNNAAAMARLQFQGGVSSNQLPSFGSNLGQSFGSNLGTNLSGGKLSTNIG